MRSSSSARSWQQWQWQDQELGQGRGLKHWLLLLLPPWPPHLRWLGAVVMAEAEAEAVLVGGPATDSPGPEHLLPLQVLLL